MKRHHRIPNAALFLAVVLSTGCAGTMQHHRDGTLGADTNAFPELSIVRGEPSSRGVLLVISDDIFVEEVELKASAQRDLAAVAGYLKKHPDQKLVITGAAKNRSVDMTRRRGAAVEAFFLKSGVDPQRVETTTARTGGRTATAAASS